MKNAEIRELSTEELKELIATEKERLWKLKMSHVVFPLEKPHELKEKKRLIARLLTELRRRELAEHPETRKLKRNQRSRRIRKAKKLKAKKINKK